MLLDKEVLSPITYCIPGKDGKNNLWSFTPADIDNLQKTGEAMLSAGVHIPVPLEHQDSAVPMTSEEMRKMTADKKADFARNNAGWVKKYFKKDGKLYAKVDILDQDLLKNNKLATTLPFVSPKIRPQFTSYDNKTYYDCITHLALTPQPVWHHQKPFDSQPKTEVSMSMLEAPIPVRWRKAHKRMELCLSMADAVTQEQGKWKPILEFATPIEEPNAEKEDALDDELTNEETEDQGKNPDEQEEGKFDKTAEKEKELAAVKKYLENEGIHLPGDTNCKNFLSHLRIALHAKQGAEKEDEGEGNDEGSTGKRETGPSAEEMAKAQEEPQMLAMSQLQNENKKLKGETARLRKKASEAEYNSLLANIEKCSAAGIKPTTIEKWKNVIGTKQMSFADSTLPEDILQVKAQVEFALDNLERLDDRSLEERAMEYSHAHTPTRPAWAKEENDEEEAKDTVDLMLSMVNPKD